jgi:hypothetical protein
MMILRQTREFMIPWQWHTEEPFEDEIDGSMQTYYAGFRTKDAALAYGRRHGWSVPQQQGNDNAEQKHRHPDRRRPVE